MTSKLRMKGSMLVSGNAGFLTLTLATATVIVLCANLSVVLYEVTLRQQVHKLFGEYENAVNLILSVFIILFCLSVYSSAKLGTDRFLLRRAQKKGGTAGDIFYYFHPLRAVGAFFFTSKMLFVKLLVTALSFFPFLLCCVLIYNLMKNNVSLLVAYFMAGGCLAFLISGIVFYKEITLSFFLAPYYFIEGRYVSFSHLIASSQKDMQSRKKVLRRLKISFSGWLFLCIFVLPVGYVWSYYKQTMALAAEAFMKN